MNKDKINVLVKSTLGLGVGAAFVVGINNIDNIYDSFQPRISVEYNNDKDNVIAAKENENLIDNYSFASYDDKTNYYVVDIDKMFCDFLLKNDILTIKSKNNAVDKSKEVIKEFLGDKVYAVDIYHNSINLTDLKGNFIQIGTSEDFDYIYLTYNDGKNAINISGSNEYYNYDFENIKDNYMSFDKFAQYNDVTSLIYRRNDNYLFSLHLHTNELSIYSMNGNASIKINKEEYETLYDEMKKYDKNDNIKAFLNNNKELLVLYLEEIKNTNVDMYNELVASYDALISEDSKTLVRNK